MTCPLMLSQFALQEKPAILWFQLRTNILGSEPIFFWSKCSEWSKIRCGNQIGTCSIWWKRGPWVGEILILQESSRLESERYAYVDLERGKEKNATNADRWMESGGKVCQTQNFRTTEVENEDQRCRKGVKESDFVWQERKSVAN